MPPRAGGFLSSSSRIFRDVHFRIAVGAGILFWIAFAAIVRPSPDPAWPVNQFRQFLSLAIVYPVLEEIVFRGYLQGMLRRWKYGTRSWLGITSANGITSLMFTALHFINHPPLAASGVIVPSLIFGYFRDRHGNIYAALMLHMFYNLGYFWLFGSASRGS